MFAFLRTKPSERAAEVRAALQAAGAGLEAARERLGTAVADGDEGGARHARAEIARLADRIAELTAALPVAERRSRAAAEREEARRRAEEARAANAQRAKRIAAARKVDAALTSLGKAFAEYAATPTGGRVEDRAILGRRSKNCLLAAVLHAAPTFATAADMSRVPMAHRRSLEDSEAGILPEFDEPRA